MAFAYTDPTINPRNGAPTVSFRSPCWVEGAIPDDELMFMTGRESEAIYKSDDGGKLQGTRSFKLACRTDKDIV